MAQRWHHLKSQSASFHIFEFEFTGDMSATEYATTRYLVVDDDDDSLEFVQEHLREVFVNMLIQ
jgi:hypothetical protein